MYAGPVEAGGDITLRPIRNHRRADAARRAEAHRDCTSTKEQS
jgi:hypothetical protein